MAHNILIAGDSWGRGEWNKKLEVTHYGLEQYLDDSGSNVKNISKAGGSLEEILENIKKENLDFYDFIFVFVTCTNRSVTNKYTQQENFFNLSPFCKETIIQRHTDILNNFFTKLNTLDKKIYLLGGLSNIPVINYDNLCVAIPSILKLLLPDIAKEYEFFFHLGNKYPLTIDKETVNWMWEQNKIWESIQASDYFKEDGYHPNRDAHRIIYKYLKENIIDKDK